ncbi:MAG: hypothetical protein QHH07_04845 [Sedimentisphaerales bacterium]|jgi:cytochrome c553|nr:hypothetical protein [Sedimentisphaerales bacterium]
MENPHNTHCNQEDLFEQLQACLLRQIEAIRTHRWADLEKAMQEGQRLAEQVQSSQLHLSDHQIEQLATHYQRLALLARAHMAMITSQLASIRQGRRLIRTYNPHGAS